MPKFTYSRFFITGTFWLLILIRVAAAQSNNDNHRNPLYIDPATQDFSENPKLLKRILAGPHWYFRFINIPFSQEICRLFQDELQGTPSFNLHGDAHLEQYAVTEIGRGLTDFDYSTTGPGVLDLARFGTSLHLTCRANGWPHKANELMEKFLSGYRAALDKPDTEAPEPVLVQAMQAKFTFDRTKHFEWIDSLMDPMPEKEAHDLDEAMQPYVESMLIQKPRFKKEFFTIQNAGYLRIGIGSALDIKYLVRIRGHTENPNDDVVLEVKEVRDLSGINCIAITQKSDPFRILLGQARIAYQPYDFLGYLRFRGRAFWVHSWVDNYMEMSIEESFETPEQLAEIVYDVGVQLGQGHPKQIAAPFDIQVRREQVLFLKKYDTKIKEACRELADQTVEAWKLFKEKVENPEG